LSAKCLENQNAIAAASGISALVGFVGTTAEKGQLMAAEALASLALDNQENQASISGLLIKLLADSSPDGTDREKGARAISRFADAGTTNQDALALAGGVELIVSLLEPRTWELEIPQAGSGGFKGDKGDNTDGGDEEMVEELVDSSIAEHYVIQRELAMALWSMSHNNTAVQQAIASAGGVPLLISLLSDDPEIHRSAAGALWSLAADARNQKLIAAEGGIPHLVELLRTGKKNCAQETAAGALRSLAQEPENRNTIADADGIACLVPLFDGGTDMAKTEVTGGLLTLVIDNPANQFIIASKLVAMLAAGPADATEATNVAAISKVEAQEHASNVIYHLTLDRDNKGALSRTAAIYQLVRVVKGGPERGQ